MADLQVVVENQIWEVPHTIRMLPGVHLPARMLALRLDDHLALWSPVPMTAEVSDAIERIAPVRYIIAPNNYHHLYLRPAMERFPDAEVWAAPGLREKRSDLNLTNFLTIDAVMPFAAHLSTVPLDGQPLMQETVFLHVATRTAIVTDSVFNLGEVTGALSPLMFKVMGMRNGPCQSRIWRSILKDKPAMIRSLQAVLEHDFDRLIMAHGTIVESGGPMVLREAASWLLPE